MKNPFRSTRIFIGEMVGELQKATWPTKTELRDSTIVVIVAIAMEKTQKFAIREGGRTIGAGRITDIIE